MRADASRLVLLMGGGGILALLTLLGVLIQAKAVIEVGGLLSALSSLGLALLFLLAAAVIDAFLAGMIAAMTLDPAWEGSTDHIGIVYFFSLLAWVMAIILVLIAFWHAGRSGLVALTDIYDALPAPPLKP